MKVGDPIELNQFIASRRDQGPHAVARTVRRSILTFLYREEKVVEGPTLLPIHRVQDIVVEDTGSPGKDILEEEATFASRDDSHATEPTLASGSYASGRTGDKTYETGETGAVARAPEHERDAISLLSVDEISGLADDDTLIEEARRRAVALRAAEGEGGSREGIERTATDAFFSSFFPKPCAFSSRGWQRKKCVPPWRTQPGHCSLIKSGSRPLRARPRAFF